MIRHTIIFKTKHDVVREVVNQALTDFQEVMMRLPGILAVISDKCDFHDEKSMQFFEEGASHAISIDFATDENLQQFFQDQKLDAIKQNIVDVAEGGYGGIVGLSMQLGYRLSNS